MRFTAALPFAFLLSVASVAHAQMPGGPPSVGVVRALVRSFQVAGDAARMKSASSSSPGVPVA